MVQSYVSTLFAVLTAVYCALTIVSCDPPTSTLTNPTLLSETLFRNEYCKKNMSYMQVKLLAFFATYMVYDVSLIFVFMTKYAADVK